MAELGGASVFTSGGGAGPDLLQQAFQQVVDEDDQDGEFVAFLQGDGGESQVIQLTEEQAAALGITFKVEDEEAQEQQQQLESGFQECGALEEPQQQTLTQEESQRIIEELAQTGLLKHEDNGACTDFDDWTVQQQNGQNENFHSGSLDSDLALDSVKLEGLNEQQNTVAEQTNVLHIQQSETEELLQEQDIPKTIETQCNENILQNTIQFSIASNNAQINNISESQAQILQRFPVILPSSQFIIKPAQTLLTPIKNIRLIPSTTKVANTVQTSQNSLLLPKTTLINTISPQILKALPIGTQFVSATNNVPTQILTASSLFAKTSDSDSNQLINQSLCTTSNTNLNTSNNIMTQNLIHQSSVQKTVQTQIQQKGNLQQFFTPILKTTPNALGAVKSTSLLSNNLIKQNSPNPILKSIQLPTQMLKTTYIKSPIATLASPKHTNSPMIFRTTPVLKTEDCKPTSVPASPLIRTQASTTPVSILKPQTKIVNNNSAKQNYSNAVQKTPLTKTIEMPQAAKPLVTAKTKQTLNSIMKSIKKKTIPQKTVTIPKQEATDANKPLGSSENPIQIVQQGHTFHSMQRLTQAQLKQIAQVLQQRSLESSNPNEKVVYRLVFPDEMDLRMKSPNSLLKNRGGKRGRPKKSSIRPPVVTNKPAAEEEQEESKDDRKKIVARTRSGRLSRPPRHMVRDYKHLHHSDFMHPDLDDSDGGYSDYNTSGSGTKIEEEEGTRTTELLAGLEIPKRKISDHFRCPKCNKIYLGRSRMGRHFEMHPDHGSLDQLPPPTADSELKQQTPPQDPLKRKGKKRGPWAYVTPEAKSERRQSKLQEAISVCEGREIAKIAGKPVVNSLSLFELLVLKSENNVRTFLSEVKELVERVREKTSTMLSVASNQDKLNDDVVDLNEELLCDVLALNSGFYRVNEAVCLDEAEERHSNGHFEIEGNLEPPMKVQKTEGEEGKENIEERLSSGFSESSDLSVSDFLNERRNDSNVTVNCPEVLSALTLMPRNNTSSPVNNVVKVNNVSKVLSSGAEVQTTDNPGFQKLSINVTTKANCGYMKEGTFTKLGENLDSSCTDVFTKLNGNYDHIKQDNMQRTFIKLEPTEEGFIKLGNGMLGTFPQEIEDFGKIQNNGFHYVSGGASDSFNGNKGFRKLVPNSTTTTVTSSVTTPVPNDQDIETTDDTNHQEVVENSVQITTSSNSSNTESNIFETSDNLDISKISYDHITHLDILNSGGVIDKNLMIDDKLVEHLHLVDNSNIVDEIVSERLKSMMPETLLESNLLSSNGNLDTELDFDELSEEFNRNTRS